MSYAFFFATRNELQSRLAAMERVLSLAYVRLQPYEKRDFEVYRTVFDISNLYSSDGRPSDAFLLLPSEQKVFARRIVEIPDLKPDFFGIRPGWRRTVAVALSAIGIRLPGGRVRYEVDPNDFSGAVIFSAGGQFDDRTLISGKISAASSAVESRRAYSEVTRELFKDFKQIKSFMVGPEAQVMLREGARLTTDVTASAVIDLRV